MNVHFSGLAVAMTAIGVVMAGGGWLLGINGYGRSIEGRDFGTVFSSLGLLLLWLGLGTAAVGVSGQLFLWIQAAMR